MDLHIALKANRPESEDDMNHIIRAFQEIRGNSVIGLSCIALLVSGICNAEDEVQKQTIEIFKAISDDSKSLENIGNALQERDKAVKKDQNYKSFAGIGFGAGLSATFNVGEKQSIEEAELVNGIVRVKKENDAVLRLLLETHYFFVPGNNPKDNYWGYGPYIGLQTSDEDIIEAIGLGIMFGLRRQDDQGIYSGDSFNIGIGAIVDPNVKTLGDGIEANKPLPDGETAIRYKETSQIGLMLLASFKF